MPTDPTAEAEMFAVDFAGALGAFTVCLMCGALLADGGKDLHREWHEAITTTEGSTSRPSDDPRQETT